MSPVLPRLIHILAAVSLVLTSPSCALLKPRSATPEITAPRNGTPTPRLRESGFAPRETAPSAQPAPTFVATNPAPTNSATVTGPYRMRAGDTILINIRIPAEIVRRDAPQEDIIDDSGMVNFPIIGRMLARGKTTSEFEQEIEQKYKTDQIYKEITVNIVIPQRFIFVTGEVRLSNKFPLVAGMTFLGAISSAGGLNEWADPKKIQLIRAGKPTTHNYIEMQKNPTLDVPLEAGDQIVVPRSWY